MTREVDPVNMDGHHGNLKRKLMQLECGDKKIFKGESSDCSEISNESVDPTPFNAYMTDFFNGYDDVNDTDITVDTSINSTKSSSESPIQHLDTSFIEKKQPGIAVIILFNDYNFGLEDRFPKSSQNVTSNTDGYYVGTGNAVGLNESNNAVDTNASSTDKPVESGRRRFDEMCQFAAKQHINELFESTTNDTFPKQKNESTEFHESKENIKMNWSSNCFDANLDAPFSSSKIYPLPKFEAQEKLEKRDYFDLESISNFDNDWMKQKPINLFSATSIRKKHDFGSIPPVYDNSWMEQPPLDLSRPPHLVLLDLGLSDLGPIDKRMFDEVYRSPEFAASSKKMVNDLFASIQENDNSYRQQRPLDLSQIQEQPLDLSQMQQQPLELEFSDLGPISENDTQREQLDDYFEQLTKNCLKKTQLYQLLEFAD